jgi:hypothetical protein
VPVPSADAARSEAGVLAGLETTLQRAASLPEDALQVGVNGEWSTVQSLRHIVLVIDLWLSKVILGADDPFHPMALPPSFMPPKLPGSSIDPDARPSFDEACDALRGRLESVQAYVDALTDADLARPVQAHAETVGGALNVLFTELKAHNSFINRDLDVLGSG